MQSQNAKLRYSKFVIQYSIFNILLRFPDPHTDIHDPESQKDPADHGRIKDNSHRWLEVHRQYRGRILSRMDAVACQPGKNHDKDNPEKECKNIIYSANFGPFVHIVDGTTENHISKIDKHPNSCAV